MHLLKLCLKVWHWDVAFHVLRLATSFTETLKIEGLSNSSCRRHREHNQHAASNTQRPPCTYSFRLGSPRSLRFLYGTAACGVMFCYVMPGLCSSCVSDCCSNSIRVVKTTKQTAPVPVSTLRVS